MTSIALRSTPTTRLLSRLVELPHLDRIVRELPHDRFTALVREIGVEDAGELVALASTEQLVPRSTRTCSRAAPASARPRARAHTPLEP